MLSVPCSFLFESHWLARAIAAGFAEDDVVVRVGVKGRIEVNEIDTGVREFVPVAQPGKVIAEIKPVHLQ